MRASTACTDLIKRFDGLTTKAFRQHDGLWVIGYGHRSSEQPGEVVTKDKAELMLQADVARLARKIEQALDAAEVEITQAQFDALVANAYACGFAAFITSSLWVCIERGDFNGALQAFDDLGHDKCPFARNKRLRRQAEKMLFMSAS